MVDSKVIGDVREYVSTTATATASAPMYDVSARLRHRFLFAHSFGYSPVFICIPSEISYVCKCRFLIRLNSFSTQVYGMRVRVYVF